MQKLPDGPRTSRLSLDVHSSNIRDASTVESRVTGLRINDDVAQTLLDWVEEPYVQGFLIKIGSHFLNWPVLRLTENGLGSQLHRWTNESHTEESKTEDLYVSIAVSYYISPDWDIVRELRYIAIDASQMGLIMNASGQQMPVEWTAKLYTAIPDALFDDMMKDITSATPAQNLAAAMCQMSLTMEMKSDDIMEMRFLGEGEDNMRSLMHDIAIDNANWRVPFKTWELPVHTNPRPDVPEKESSKLREYLEAFPLLQPLGCLPEIQDTVLLLGEFPNETDSVITLCLFDMQPSRIAGPTQPQNLLHPNDRRFDSLLKELSTLQNVPWAVQDTGRGAQPRPSRLLQLGLKPPPYLAPRSLKLEYPFTSLPSLDSAISSSTGATLSILLSHYLSHAHSLGFTTTRLYPLTTPSKEPLSSSPMSSLSYPLLPSNRNPTTAIFHSISSLAFYQNWSFEELRLSDYAHGIRGVSSLPGMAMLQVGPEEGTVALPYATFEESFLNPVELLGAASLTVKPYYRGYSFEELRLVDYAGGRRWGTGVEWRGK
ncbi:MAG: hypothetical protein M1820_002808 [Bogoriella megaspora]|nr:MAG: hypothetical protein M1820_002808 [Bogoriella megaspora]